MGTSIGILEGILRLKDELSPALERAANNMEKAASRMKAAGQALLPVTGAIAGLGLAAIKVAGDLEQTRMAFTTMLGSAQKANAFLKDMQKFAEKTPFEFPDLIKASQRLLAMGFSAEKIKPMLTNIGDAAAGLGAGSEGIDRMVRALGQMQAKGKVSAEEINQLTEIGVRGWDLVANKIGVSVPKAMEMASKGMITGVTGVNAILEGLGSQFGGMMDKQSATLLGRFSTLKDELRDVLRELGDAMMPIATQVMDAFMRMVPVLKQWVAAFAALPTSVKTGIVVFAALVAAIGPLLIALGGMAAIIAPALVALKGVLAVVAALAGPIGAVVAVLGVFALVWFKLGGSVKDFLLILLSLTGPLGMVVAIFIKWGADIKNVVMSVYNSAKEWLVDQWNGSIFQSIARMLDELVRLFIALKPLISMAVQAVYNEVKQWLFDQLQLVLTGIKIILAPYVAPFMALKSLIGPTVQSIFNTVKEWLVDKFEAVVGGAKMWIDKITSMIRMLRQNVEAATGKSGSSAGITATATMATLGGGGTPGGTKPPPDDGPSKERLAQMKEAAKLTMQLEEDLAQARAKSIAGLDGAIAKIDASTAAKIREIEANKKLTAADKERLSALAATVGAAQIDAEKAAAARQGAAAAAKHQADAEKLLGEAVEAGMSAFELSIHRIDARRDATIRAIEADLKEKEALGQLTPELRAAAQSHKDAAKAVADGAKGLATYNHSLEVHKNSLQMVNSARQAYLQSSPKISNSLKSQIEMILMQRDANIDQAESAYRAGRITKEAMEESIDLYNKAAEAAIKYAQTMDFANKLESMASGLDSIVGSLEKMGILSSKSGLGEMLGQMSGLMKGGANFAKAYATGDAVGMATSGMDLTQQIFSLGQQGRREDANLLEKGARYGLMGLPGVIGGLIPSEGEKAGREFARFFGEAASAEMEEQMQAIAEELDINYADASMLMITEAMDKGGKEAREYQEQVQHLFNAVELGTIPSKQGIEELGGAFTRMRDEAEQAGRVGDRAMVQMIQRSRELGMEVPEITEHVKAQLEKAMGGLAAVTGTPGKDGEPVKGGLAIASQDDANAQAQIFSAVFWAKVKEDGIIAAATAMEEPFAAMEAKMAEAGMNVESVMGPIRNIMALTANETTKGIAQGITGLQDVLGGLADSGYMTEGAFAGVQQQAGSAFAQLKAEGVDTNTALQAIAPLLGDLKSAATEYGLALDPATQALITQAEQAGIAFPTDPMQQMVDLLSVLVTTMGGELPASVTAAAGSMTTLGDSSAAAVDTVEMAVSDTAGLITSEMTAMHGTVEGSMIAMTGNIDGSMKAVGDAIMTTMDNTQMTVENAMTLAEAASSTAADSIIAHVDALNGLSVFIPVTYSEGGLPGAPPPPDPDVTAAAGFEGWVHGPTRFLAGEAGPEYVSVTPKSQMGGGGGGGGGETGPITIAPVFNVPVQGDPRTLGLSLVEMVERGVLPELETAIARRLGAS